MAEPKPAGTFIDLFAGCGGLSLGLMQAGWRGLFAVEKDRHAWETLSSNLVAQEVPTYAYDWPNWLPKEPIEIGSFNQRYHRRLRELRGSVDLIAGGPPCQGFSFSGRRKKDDERNHLFERYIKAVELVQPRFLLLENVKGIAIAHGKKQRAAKPTRGRRPTPFAERIRNRLEKLGYQVVPGIVKAADVGVPQLRPRYIIVGIRQDLAEEGGTTPDPFALLESLRESFLAGKGLPVDRPISVGEALSDLEVTGRKRVECVDSPGFEQIQYERPLTDYQRLLHGSMNGTSPNSLRLARHRPATLERFERMLAVSRRGVSLSKEERQELGLKKHTVVVLDAEKPSHTLTTLPDDFLHYSEPRILTVRECARLQSFPDWFEFKGKYTTGADMRTKEAPRYTQVGNAVPPFLGEILGRALSELQQVLNPGPAHGSRPRPVTPGSKCHEITTPGSLNSSPGTGTTGEV